MTHLLILDYSVAELIKIAITEEEEKALTSPKGFYDTERLLLNYGFKPSQCAWMIVDGDICERLINGPCTTIVK